MPLSSKLAPGFVRLRYTGITIPHTQVIPIKFASVPTPGINPDLETSAGGSEDFLAAMTLYVGTALAPQFNADTGFGFADIYSVDAETGVRTFIYTATIPLEGTNVGANVALVEGVWVFKTTAGKPLKVYTMEAVYAADVRNIGTVPADARQDMIDYILSDDNIFYGRTDSWPLAFQTFTSKENDVLRKRSGFFNL